MRHLRVDDSSNVASFGYDLAGERLQIQFSNGGLYEYAHVKPEVFASLASSDSVGKWVARELVAKKWPFEKLRAESAPEEKPSELERYRTALQLIASWSGDPTDANATGELVALAKAAL